MIETVAIAVLSATTAFFANMVLRLRKDLEFNEEQYKIYNSSLSNAYVELATEKNRPKEIKFGVVQRYDQNDIDAISSNEQFLKSVMTVLTYFAAIKTDALRIPDNQSDTMRLMKCVGEANYAQEILLFFYKLANPEPKTK